MWYVAYVSITFAGFLPVLSLSGIRTCLHEHVLIPERHNTGTKQANVMETYAWYEEGKGSHLEQK